MEGGAWWATVHGVAESRTRLSNFTSLHSAYRASLVAELVAQLQCRKPWFDSWSGRSPGKERGYLLQYSWASLVTQPVKNPPAMWETWVGKITLEGMAAHTSILA